MHTVHDMKELGRAIRARRKELGYTQAFLADYAGVSASFLSELENGKETIQVGKMMEVISLLGMDIKMSRRGE
ncbi:MAG: helix-turn-helix transcriptional regulator [Mogibacterium sp.]|jgi:y4mF family transcriptional regulator|nr:helix-turn-helix transcriptional regulator [Mogibacterium sp.]MBQ9075892.1 helix-turn-helix transcriptional regulator [Mogibacterium sp.]